MADPGVVLTDYALAIECGVLAWRSGRASALARRSRLLFAATVVATLAGGTAHGFRAGAVVLWRVALLATGVAASAASGAGACLVGSPRAAAAIVRVAAIALVVYAAAVVGGADTFAVAIAGYLAASVVLLAGFAVAFVRAGACASLAGVAGIGATFVGACLQQAHVGLPALSLDHNALFHVVQGVAFACLFRAFRRLEGRIPCSPAATS
jgi:hypothetical protein